MKYRYTADYPSVFADLSYGPDVYVTPEDGPEGSTVVLKPGDILTVTKPLDHAWLEEIPEPSVAKAPKASKVAAPLAVETPPEAPPVVDVPSATPTQGE